MELVAFTLQGYRRFVEKTSVKLHGGIVALVGPNEAGKSSLLDAIAHLHKDGEFARTERPRRVNCDTELSWHFRVETEDRAALAEVPEATELEQVIITKRNDGTKAWAMQPRPVRDKSHRVPLAQALRDRYNDPTVSEAADSEDLEELFDNAIEVLDRDKNNFDGAEITALTTLEDRLRNLSNAWAPSEETEEGEPPADRDPPMWMTSLADDLRKAADAESQESPWAHAKRILEGRLPAIHVLTAEDRALSSTYELEDEADSPSSALRHLAVLADLDLQALRDEAVSGQVPDVSTRRNRANEVLKQRFRESWGQSEVAIQLEVQGTVLHIQATTPGDKGLSTIEERSDGMRWFAALLAYCYGWAKKPIVLMDEIETHLHYDAQVDLIGVLTRQPFTSKVIYTTHSFASLPLDLGRGVRVVHPIDESTSRLENGFWQGGAGFSPLLARMGSAALAFTPTRRALIGEGAGDAILLPSIFREVMRVESPMPFQVAPGLASVAEAGVPDLDAEAGRVAFIVDGDQGGLDNAAKLRRANVASERIIVLTDGDDAIEVEDLVDPQTYLDAVNAELKFWNPNAITHTMQTNDLGRTLVSKSVDRWCSQMSVSAPDKAAVAQRIVEANEDDISHPDRKETIWHLLESACLALEIPQKIRPKRRPNGA